MYNLRSRPVMAAGADGASPPLAFPLAKTPENQVTTPEGTQRVAMTSVMEMEEEEDGLLNEQMPCDLYIEQIEGLTQEIQSLQVRCKSLNILRIGLLPMCHIDV